MDEGPGFIFAVGDLDVVYLRGGGVHFISALIFRLFIILQINMKMCLCFYWIIYFLEDFRVLRDFLALRFWRRDFERFPPIFGESWGAFSLVSLSV